MTHKILLSCAAIAALFFTACGGGESDAETSLEAEVIIPDEPAAAIQTIAEEMMAGNGGILWKAMPASYQADVNEIAQLAGTKVDAEIYDKSFSLVGRLAEVADKQKTFILNTKLVGEQPAEEIAKTEAAWPSMIGFVRTIAISSIASSEGLQAFDGQVFADQTISPLFQYAKDLAVLSGEENPFDDLDFGSIKTLESTDSTAVLEMTSPEGEVETEEFTKVESRWVPTEMATEWSKQMAEAKAQLEAISPEEMAQNKPQIIGMITMVEGILSQLDAAETQEQFDQALQGAMLPFGMLMMQGMGGGMGAPAPPTAP